MDDNLQRDAVIENIWKFVRGDVLILDFEKWIYSDPSVESVLGKDLYFDAISTNYSSIEEVLHIKKNLMQFASSHSRLSCCCMQLSDIAIVDMGEESHKYFINFKEVKKRGDPFWWLSVYQCQVCKQSWLVGQEERQNDVFCLYRIAPNVMEDIIGNSQWPTIFDHYEALLRFGIEAGRSARFIDPLNSSSIRWTISDLAKDKPGISTSEIAELLNLDIELAEEISRKVIREDHVQITFSKNK